jgi:Protein of unknown function (DUF2934)
MAKKAPASRSTAKLNRPADRPENISRALAKDHSGPAAERVQQAPGDALAARPVGDPTDEDIRARAYQMYLERGGHHGLDFDDWLRAERELRRR